MRNRFAEVLYNLSQKDNKIRVVAADISPAGKMAELSARYPDRFINVGVAETSMISLCAGLAMSGLKPFAYTISTFSLFRPFEMVRVDIGYQNLPVVIVGMGAGTTYSTLGSTHITQEDVSIVRSIPNFQVLLPCDPDELEKCLVYLCKKNKSPTYLRIGKSGEKNFTKGAEKWVFSKPRCLVRGKKICLIASGPIIRLYFDILKKLQLINIKPSIYSFHTLKPVNESSIRVLFKKYDYIVTLEDMSEINGLASILKESACKNKYKGNIITFSLKDKFLKNYGSQDYLLKMHCISSLKIFHKLKKLLKK
jgi:transketolase